MSDSCLNDAHGVNLLFIEEFNAYEEAVAFSQLHDYGNVRGFDLENADDLTAISRQVYRSSYKPSWGDLRHHLLSTTIPNQLFRGIWETYLSDRKNGFKKERMFRGVDNVYPCSPMRLWGAMQLLFI